MPSAQEGVAAVASRKAGASSPLLQWILHGFPALRPWLCSVYDDLHRPLGTNISINPTFWAGIASHLQEDMCFSSSPPGTNITKGAKLLSARHINIQSKSDLQKVPVTTKRIWMRVADPSSSRRRLSAISRETLEFFYYLSSREWRPRPLRPAPLSLVASAADAFGKGNDCGVGGWLRFPNGTSRWFSQRFTVQDFTLQLDRCVVCLNRGEGSRLTLNHPEYTQEPFR